ncbi:unnamed protein product [Ectocarpus fasciculatus]
MGKYEVGAVVCILVVVAAVGARERAKNFGCVRRNWIVDAKKDDGAMIVVATCAPLAMAAAEGRHQSWRCLHVGLIRFFLISKPKGKKCVLFLSGKWFRFICSRDL